MTPASKVPAAQAVAPADVAAAVALADAVTELAAAATALAELHTAVAEWARQLDQPTTAQARQIAMQIDRQLPDLHQRLRQAMADVHVAASDDNDSDRQQLHQRFQARGFEVLGFPCNQFGAQEPGDEAEIGAFCERNYGVAFPMFAKVEVNGAQAHPLWTWLRSEAPGLLGSEAIKWNFTKFLVRRDGSVFKRYAPQASPESIAEDIEVLLADPGY